MVIAGIEGIIRSKGTHWIIVDVGGVSFRVHVATSTLSTVGSPGARVYLHTSLQVREDSLNLYGFSSIEELSLFDLLIGVSGIGPRVALSILSTFPVEKFILIVASGDDALLSSVPGIGKKTAARIILELKGKFEHPAIAVSYQNEDVKAALMELGYSAAEATNACISITDSPDVSLEDKIKLALRYFAHST